MSEIVFSDPSFHDLLDPSGSIDPPRNLTGSVSSDRTLTNRWEAPLHGDVDHYELHEFLKHPENTLKATLPAGTLSRTSGVLEHPANLEYAIRAVDTHGNTSKFSATSLVEITSSGGTVTTGRPVGWDADPSVSTDPGGARSGTAVFPMDLMGDGWYLTTPEPGSSVSPKAWEVYKDGRGHPVSDHNPDLDRFVRDTNEKRTFKLNVAKDGIIMSTDFEGSHTPHSNNTRMEFREMESDGRTEAAWSTRGGRHQCEIVTQVDRLDGNHMVIGQIHGGNQHDDDLTVFRLEGRKLWITKGNTAHGHLVADDYELHTKITIKFDVDPSGDCSYYFNGTKVEDFTLSLPFDDKTYFKAGAYLQLKGSAGSWGQVTLYEVTISHD